MVLSEEDFSNVAGVIYVFLFSSYTTWALQVWKFTRGKAKDGK